MAITEIKPVTRIEGDGKLELESYTDSAGKLRVKNLLTPNDGTIVLPTDNAARYPKFCVTEFRGFEKFVLGEAPEVVSNLVPRICGVCPIPHAMASSMSIEDAYGTVIPANGKNVRRLMNALHTVHSHLLHIFVLGSRDFLPHAIIDQELANIIDAHNKSQACVSVLGGKPVHAAGIIPGGQTYRPTVDEVDAFKARMAEIKAYAASLLPAISATLLAIPNDFGIRSANYMSSGIPFYTGVAGSYSYNGSSGGVVISDPDSPTDFAAATIVPFNPANVLEEEIVPYGEVADFVEKYSYARRPFYTYGGRNYVVEVGPLARLAVAYKAGDAVVKPAVDAFASSLGVTANDILSPSTRNRHVARVLELLILIDLIIDRWADAVDHSNSDVVPFKKAGSGVGVIEAPRGTLIHKITVASDLTTGFYSAIVPTTVNTPAIEEAVTDDLIEIRPETVALLKPGEDPASKDLKLLLGDASRTVRGFDPCCSCSSHVLVIKYPDGTVRRHL
jgi:coenzyme F420-reducing hydrogenase alpha subunit